LNPEIKIINVVQKEEDVQILKEKYHQEYVFNSESPTFKKDIHEAIKSLGPTVLYEYLGGDLPGHIFKMLPPSSWMLCIANLTDSPNTFDSNDLRWNGKNITSMDLTRYMSELTEDERKYYRKSVSNFYHEDHDFFETKVKEVIKMEEWKKAVEEAKVDLSSGKIVLDLS